MQFTEHQLGEAATALANFINTKNAAKDAYNAMDLVTVVLQSVSDHDHDSDDYEGISPEALSTLADGLDKALELAVRMKNSAIAQGFDEHIAQMMAANTYSSLSPSL